MCPRRVRCVGSDHHFTFRAASSRSSVVPSSAQRSSSASARSTIRDNWLFADGYPEKDLADELPRWDFQFIITGKESLPLIGHPAQSDLKGPPEHINDRIVCNPIGRAANCPRIEEIRPVKRWWVGSDPTSGFEITHLAW